MLAAQIPYVFIGTEGRISHGTNNRRPTQYMQGVIFLNLCPVHLQDSIEVPGVAANCYSLFYTLVPGMYARGVVSYRVGCGLQAHISQYIMLYS